MRFWSSLLLVTFSGVLTTAPAARLPRAGDETPPKTAGADVASVPSDEAEKPAQKREPTQDTDASRVVVLRGSEPGDEDCGSDTGELTFRFEQAPALRGRKLATARPPQPPHMSIAGADVRAGLSATPPPAA